MPCVPGEGPGLGCINWLGLMVPHLRLLLNCVRRLSEDGTRLATIQFTLSGFLADVASISEAAWGPNPGSTRIIVLRGVVIVESQAADPSGETIYYKSCRMCWPGWVGRFFYTTHNKPLLVIDRFQRLSGVYGAHSAR